MVARFVGVALLVTLTRSDLTYLDSTTLPLLAPADATTTSDDDALGRFWPREWNVLVKDSTQDSLERLLGFTIVDPTHGRSAFEQIQAQAATHLKDLNPNSGRDDQTEKVDFLSDQALIVWLDLKRSEWARRLVARGANFR